MPSVIVLGGTSGFHIAYDLSRLLRCELGGVEVRRFPDGEVYVRVEADVGGRDVVYVNSLQPSPDSKIVETLYTLDALRDLGARRVLAVIPYMAYARQDERFNPGEAVSIISLAKLFRAVGADSIYTVDMHLHRIRDPTRLFGASFHNLTAVAELAKYILRNHGGLLEKAVVVGPDEEAEQWAKIMSQGLGGLEYTVLEKRRLSAEEVAITTRDLDVRGRNVVIVDDIISTGGTIVEAVKALKKQGAEEVVVSCVHPLLVGDAYYRILRLGIRDLAGTDTVLSPVSKVPIAPPIADAIRRDLGL